MYLIGFFLFFFPAIAELLDNAVDEVKMIILQIYVLMVHHLGEIIFCGFS